MSVKLIIILLAVLLLTQIKAQDYHETYPILTEITDQDPLLQQFLFRYVDKNNAVIESSNEAVQSVLEVRDSLSILLTPVVREWLKQHFKGNYEIIWDLNGEIQPLMMNTFMMADTLYALFAYNHDYILELRSTEDFWMYLQYKQWIQYVDFGRKHDCEHTATDAFFNVAKTYEELQMHFPESPYLASIQDDYAYCLGKLMDIHLVQTPDTLFALNKNPEVNQNAGMVDYEYYYSISGLYRSNVDQLIENLLANTSVIEVDLNNKFASLFLISLESHPNEESARKARFQYLTKGQDIPHLMKIANGSKVAYHNIYRFYTDKTKAEQSLLKIRPEWPMATLLKTDAKGKIIK